MRCGGGIGCCVEGLAGCCRCGYGYCVSGWAGVLDCLGLVTWVADCGDIHGNCLSVTVTITANGSKTIHEAKWHQHQPKSQLFIIIAIILTLINIIIIKLVDQGTSQSTTYISAEPINTLPTVTDLW